MVDVNVGVFLFSTKIFFILFATIFTSFYKFFLPVNCINNCSKDFVLSSIRYKSIPLSIIFSAQRAISTSDKSVNNIPSSLNSGFFSLQKSKGLLWIRCFKANTWMTIPFKFSQTSLKNHMTFVYDSNTSYHLLHFI